MTIQPRFTGKRAMVTGATRGLGRTIAAWLARDGADVFISGRDQADIDGTISELERFGTTIQGAPADLADVAQTRQLAEAALASGPFDILVNNAGFSIPQSFFDVTDSEWDAEMAVNARAPFVLGQLIAKAMIDNNIAGRIVNISSVGAYAAHLRQMVYDMAKAAIIAMSRNMAYELGPHGITVNCVAPGAVPDRPGFDMSNYDDTDIRNPLNRVGSADDIANAVCFFCDDASRWVTGHTLLVDGGLIGHIGEN